MHGASRPVTRCSDKCDFSVQWRGRRKKKKRVGGKAIVWHYRLFRYGECTWWGVMGLNSNLIRQLDGQPPSHSRLTSTCLITLFGSVRVSGPECCDSVHLRTIPKCATEGVLSTPQHQGGNKWENMSQKNFHFCFIRVKWKHSTRPLPVKMCASPITSHLYEKKKEKEKEGSLIKPIRCTAAEHHTSVFYPTEQSEGNEISRLGCGLSVIRFHRLFPIDCWVKII